MAGPGLGGELSTLQRQWSSHSLVLSTCCSSLLIPMPSHLIHHLVFYVCHGHVNLRGFQCPEESRCTEEIVQESQQVNSKLDNCPAL